MTFDKIFEIVRKQNPDIEYDRLKSLAQIVFKAGYDIGYFVGEVSYADNYDGYSVRERFDVNEDDNGNAIWYDRNDVVIMSVDDYDSEFAAGYDGDTSYPVEDMEPFYIDIAPEWKFDFKRGAKVISKYKYKDDPANNTATVTIEGKKYTLVGQSDVKTYAAEDGEKVKEASLFYHDKELDLDIKFRMGFIKC